MVNTAMKRCPPRLMLFLILALAGRAQTSAWIAPGPLETGYRAAWENPAHWDSAVVPDGPVAIAVVNRATSASPSPIAGGAYPLITSDVTLGELRFDLTAAPQPQYTGLYIGDGSLAGPAGSLRLEAGGLTLAGSGTGVAPLVQLFVQSGSTLELANHATIARTGAVDLRLRLAGAFDPAQAARLVFRDDASVAAGAFAPTTASITSGIVAIEFRERSHAGDWPLRISYGATVDFFDQSSAEHAAITSPKDGSGTSVAFHDQATAADATLELQSVTFDGQSTAGAAKITNAGYQNYSGHGQYSSYFTTLSFHDQATAAQSTIINTALGRLTFDGNSTAGGASIASTGSVTFAGHAAFGSARLIAGSGSYFVGTGYNQSAEVFTGRVTFLDQAAGGSGGIELYGNHAVLDFSGLHASDGTTGRAPLPLATTLPSIVPDDRVAFSLGSITNTAPGGSIRLGGTVLSIGSDNRDMILSARITDTGGAYGSLAGEPLHGGQIYKFGTGTLTVTNPDNDFADIGVFEGTLNLAGGAMPSVVLMNSARLTGSGLVRGSLFNGASGSGALVSPGNSAGTITVTGDYIQYAGSTLAMEIGPGTTGDRLVVNGRAFLNGRLALSFPAGYVPVGSATLPFLTAGEFNGQFATVTLPPGLGAALSTAVVLAPGGLSLQVTQAPFAGFGTGSPAALATGARLDAMLPGATGDHRALLAGLNILDAAGVAAALDALAPDRYAALPEHGLLAAIAQQAARDRRLAALRGPTTRGCELFFEAGRRTAQLDAVSALPEATSTISSATAGGAWRTGPFAAGVTLTQESGELELDALGSRADVDSLGTGVFLQYAPDRFFVNGSAAFSRDDYDLRRRVVFPGYDQTATAAPRGRRTDVALNLGYVLPGKSWSLSPQVGAVASRWRLDDARETGAPGADLDLRGWSARSTHIRAGIAAGRNAGVFAPRLSVFWLHELSSARSLPAAFAGAAGPAVPAPGRPAPRHLVQASLGFDWQLGKQLVFHATAGGAWGDAARLDSDLAVGLRWSF
jgi:uncharacterized protein with beta-barrel porin domain